MMDFLFISGIVLFITVVCVLIVMIARDYFNKTLKDEELYITLAMFSILFLIYWAIIPLALIAGILIGIGWLLSHVQISFKTEKK